MADKATLEKHALQAVKDPTQKIIDWLSYAKDESENVRHATVSRQDCPADILKVMLEDANPRIKDIAAQRLQIKGMLENTPVAK